MRNAVRGKMFYQWICLCFFLSVMGCISAPKPLTEEKLRDIETLGFVTVQENDEIQILDHTGVAKKTYYGHTLGYGGLLAEYVAKEAESEKRTNSSLESSPETLGENISKFPIKSILDAKLRLRFSEEYDVADSQFDQDLKEKEAPGVADYLKVCKAAGVDTFLKIDFKYGLAVYGEIESSAAIDAKMYVYDVKTGDLLTKKSISSDTYFRSPHTLEEYMDDDAMLFKQELIDAAAGLVLRVATEFGLDLDRAASEKIGVDEEIPYAWFSCQAPYLLEQNCSDSLGARLNIEISGQRVKVAGSNSGEVILVMEDNYAAHSLVDQLTFNLGTLRAQHTNTAFEIIESELVSNGFKLIKIIKLVSTGSVNGYILVVDGNGYAFLKGFAN